MTGPDHYREAELLIEQIKNCDVPADAVSVHVAAAQVHAVLALTAATVLGRFGSMPVRDSDAWTEVLR